MYAILMKPDEAPRKDRDYFMSGTDENKVYFSDTYCFTFSSEQRVLTKWKALQEKFPKEAANCYPVEVEMPKVLGAVDVRDR